MQGPHSLGVPHDTWRPHQWETIEKLRDSPSKHIFLEAPTGSGKSAQACALGHDSKVLALVATLGLLDQYAREYQFTIIKGRQEYPCGDIDKISDWHPIVPTAYDCHHPQMHKCEFSDYCPYLTAKRRAQRAQRVAMTYKYAALAAWPKDRNGILVCDEGHSAAEEILDCADFSITDFHTQRYNAPPPKEYFHWRIQDLLTPTLHERALDYLERVHRYTKHYEITASTSPRSASGWRFHLRVGRMIEDLSLHDSWFLDASPKQFRLRPLDARPIAHRLWENKIKTVFMSATIGDPAPLAKELGIDSYDYLSTPHLIPALKRPVHVIFHDKMTKRNRDRKPGLYRAQAAAIAHFIRESVPESWRGLILTTSYHKIQMLADCLRNYSDIEGRLWQAPEDCKGVSKRVQAFLDDPSSGIIAVDTIQGWGHGLDLRGDLGRFIVVAGVPHYNPADPFDRARLKRPGGMRYARWQAYNAVVQACGRVTRGIKYEGEYMLNVAALADASCTVKSARRYYPDWFKEAFV